MMALQQNMVIEGTDLVSSKNLNLSCGLLGVTSNPGLLRIGLFNTRSVRNKLHHIAETLNEFDLDILCLPDLVIHF